MKPEVMESKKLKRLFISKLGFWSLHCAISALPGFFCAIVVMGESSGWKIEAVFPMLAAVITFVIGLAGLFTWLEAKKPLNELVRKGLTSGLRIRIVMVVAGLLILAASSSGSYQGLFYIPDMWMGIIAAFINYQIGMAFGTSSGIESLANGGENYGFGTIYALSMTVGAITALMVFILSFLCTLVFQIRSRREFIARQGACLARMADQTGRQ
jgi:hypothetical protein